MNAISATLENVFFVASLLEEKLDLTCVLAYDNNIKPTPVAEPIVGFSVRGATIGPKLSKVEDNGKVVVTDEREVDTTVSIDIYYPYSKGGIHALRLYEQIASTLINDNTVPFIKTTCNEAEYDKACQAIVLKSTFVFRTTVSS